MCVGCHVGYDTGSPKWQVRAYWGRWYNFIPPKYQYWDLLRKWPYGEQSQCCKDRWYRNTCYAPWRGEGTPAPWIMVWKENLGFEFKLERSRPWLRPELTKPSYSGGNRQWMWGFFIIAWKVR